MWECSINVFLPILRFLKYHPLQGCKNVTINSNCFQYFIKQLKKHINNKPQEEHRFLKNNY